MALIWQILVQFVLRLSLGVAIAMGITPARQVTSGFFRVHLWVLMGLNTLALLAAWSSHEAVAASLGERRWTLVFAGALGAAVLSYVGSVAWLYESARVGKPLIWMVAALSLMAGLAGADWQQGSELWMSSLDVLTGSLLLGAILAAMLLGHWYLNWPSMRLDPLKRLLLLLMAAILLRAVVALIGLGLAPEATTGASSFWAFLALRWLAGIVGAFALAVLAWQTLKVPNTQSATGILYAGVILVMIGELVSQLLSARLAFAL